MDKVKFKQLVGDDWFVVLNEVLSPEIVFEIDGVRQQYIQGKNILPDSSKVWRAFQECPYNKLKVVILNTEPNFSLIPYFNSI